MNVVVTGGGGYVGAVVVRELLDRGHAVRVVDEFADGERGLGRRDGRLELVQAEPRAVDALWLKEMDAAIHLGGLPEWSVRGNDPATNWLANAVATERLAMACRAMKVSRLVYASTCDVYAPLPAGYEYDEAAPVQPRSRFAASKFYGERRLQQLADGAFCPTILRHATAFGLSPVTHFETAPNRFVMDAVAVGRVTLPRDAWISRPFVHVADLAEAYVRCLEAPPERVRGQVFNVVHANLRLVDVGATVVDVVGRRGGYVRMTATETAAGVHDCRCSPSRLREVLGYTPDRALAPAVAELAQHLLVSAVPAERARGASAARRPAQPPFFCLPQWLLAERLEGSFTCWTGEAFDG
jgi:nucleoside-diphosphate-sugar epimerase